MISYNAYLKTSNYYIGSVVTTLQKNVTHYENSYEYMKIITVTSGFET